MFEIFFLGTSAAAPTPTRGLSAQVIQHGKYRFLIDCGEGTQHQILQAGIGFRHLSQILITHGHLDHILGLAGLLSTMMRWETIESMEVYGGKAALERIRDLLYGVVLRGAKPPIPIEMITLTPGPFFDAPDFLVTAFPVYHRSTGNLGYLFEEKPRRPFLIEKAEELKIPPGPERHDLVAGRPVTLPDGRVIAPEMVLGELSLGMRVAIVGDVGNANALVKHVSGVDVLIIEATYLEEERELAHQFAHLTAWQAATLAKQAGVKRLILTHLSSRYRWKDILSEAQAIFPDAVVANDFDTFTFKRDNV